MKRELSGGGGDPAEQVFRGAFSDDGGGVATLSCTLFVSGMDCGSCAATVERTLRRLAGVCAARADVVGGRVRVTYDASLVTPVDLAGEIARAGYRVEGEDDGARGGVSRTSSIVSGWWGRHGRRALTVASGVSWALSLVAASVFGSAAVSGLFAVVSVATGGRYVFPRGLRSLRARSLDMNFLMSIAAVGAFLIGEYVEAASVIFLFSVAQLLETYSMDRARHAVRALMDLSPAEATVLRGGREVRVPVESVEPGEIVVVRPGERIAVDGEVVAGWSSVNQAAITGESLPVDRGPGDEVFAGTLNGEGALEVRSTRRASDTSLARILHTIEEAQASRAPSQTFVDRFARVYTPLVVLSAALLMVAPPLLGFGAWSTWVYRSLVLLVVACPCALVISTPVTIVSALTGAARRGILIKGGLHLENAGRARAIAFDKTGTLTTGEPTVAEIVALDGVEPAEVLALAAAAESRSEHPLARAIVRHAAEAGLRAEPATEVTAIPGRGLRARVGDGVILIGNERLFREAGAWTDDAAEILRRHEAGGRTGVLVGRAHGASPPALLGVIGLTDRIRPEAADALRALHGAGIERVVMLTGDNATAAAAVGAALGGPGIGVDEVRAELLPEDKVDAVRALRERHGTVLMVGDGINDAPAFAAADVGVAMGTAGTDVALETADIALMGDDLSRLPDTIRFARRAERILRWNIGFALGLKAIFIALAAAGVATLWMAVLADTGASLLVVGNGLRARRA